MALGLLAGLLGLTGWRYSPPAPLPLDAPAPEFSAARAQEQLAALMGDGTPHPTGSAEAERVRQVILQRLSQLGYAPRLQARWVCSSIYSCAEVQNILAVREGTQPGAPAVMISSHYDSVAAGPGASDDGVGVAATLEIARALAGQPPLSHPVWFFLNDGEEGGLKGAEALVADPRTLASVGAVVNMEARGSGGPSLMFETSDRNAPMIALYARQVTRPVTNSLYYTIYKLLPNDTDLTVYKRVGLRGLNFAYVGNEVHYHTPLDDFGHADPGSIQHQGQNALQMVRGLAAAPLPEGTEDAVFFDLFSLGTLHFSPLIIRGLAVLALLLVGGALWRARRRDRLAWPDLGWGLLAFWGAVLGTAALAALTHAVLHTLGGFEYFFLAHPIFARVAFAAVAVSVGIGLAGALHWRSGRWGLWGGTQLSFAGVGVLLAFLSPGLSYPFVLPALVAGLVGLAGFGGVWLWVPGFLVAATLWLPVGWLLYDGIGIFGLGASAVVLQWVLAPLMPVWTPRGTSRRGSAVAAGVWLLACVGAIAAPDFTPQHPQKLNLEYQLHLDAEQSSSAQWAATPMTGPLPAAVAEAADFSSQPRQPLRWPILLPAFVAPAPVLPVAPPSFEVRELTASEGRLRIRGRLSSPRGAHEAGVVVPEGRLLSLEMNGSGAPAQRSKNLVRKLLASDGWINLASHTTGPEGVEVTFELRGTEPATVYLWDSTPGLPPEGRSLLQSRPPNAIRYQAGDRLLVTRELRLTP